MKYELRFPRRISFGDGGFREWPEQLPPGGVLVVAGNHLRERLLPLTTSRGWGLIGDIRPEPTLQEVEKVRAAARELGVRTIVGIGGGSVLDTAKAAAALLDEPGAVADYFYGRSAAAARRSFLVLLPTTAGTGAEVTGNAVLVDPATSIKQSLRTPGMEADWALVDPELTCACPAGITAASGFDALTQGIESYLSRRATTVSSALARSAVTLLYPALRAATAGERGARAPMAEGSLSAALAFAQSGLGAVHGIGHPAGSCWGVPHGVCCAVLLPTVLRWNCAVDGGARLGELARAVGLADAASFIAGLERLRAEVGLPENFRSFGASPDALPFVVRNCRSGSMKCNPRELSDEEVAALVRELI